MAVPVRGAILTVQRSVSVGSRILRYPPYCECRDSGIEWLGMIPSHWHIDRLKWTVTECRNGIWGDESDGINDLACVRVADFDRTRFVVQSEIPTVRAVAPSQRAGRMLKKGDLLLEKSGGGDLQPVGAVVLFDHHIEAVCSNFVARMPVAAGYDGRFLSYLHAALYTGRLNARSIKQTTGIQNLDSYSYLNERAAHPPLDEQRAIAAFLDRESGRIDELIAKKQRLIELLAEKRTALISHAVTKGLNPDAPMKDSGISWLGEVPAHWNLRKLGYITTMQGGGTPSKDNLAYWNGSIPWVSPKDMKRRVIDDSTEHVTEDAVAETTIRLIAPPAVLIVVRGMILSHSFPVGLTVVPVTINQDMKAITVRPGTSADFLAYLLQGIGPAFLSLVEESGHGTKCLRTDLWKGFELFMPPFDEQKQICECLRVECARQDALKQKIWTAIDRLNEYRSALISAAVTGKIDVSGEVPA